MKKIISITLCLCLLLVLCACGSGESIEGAWLAEGGGSLIGVNLTEPTSYDVYYVFNEDGTGTMLNIFPDAFNERNMATGFTYTAENDGTFVMDLGSAHSEGSYKIDGDTLCLDTTRMGEITLTRVALEDVPVVE